MKRGKTAIVLLLILSILFTSGESIIANVQATEDGYKQENDESDIPGNPKRPVSNISPWNGDYVYFGWRYKNSMKWRVLQNDGENLLLLADRTIGSRAYHDVGELNNFKYTYESSTIRRWLNSDFITETFTKEEQKYLLKNKVLNGRSSYSEVGTGPDTYDKVYLLSYDELRKAKYGFWSTGAAANSRKFYEEGKQYFESGVITYEPSLDAVWTRTLQSEFNSYGDHYSYPWWIQKNGSLSGRGAFFANPVTWSKGILPVIKIPISCPLWSNAPQEYHNTGSDVTEPVPSETPGIEKSKWKFSGLDFSYDIPDDIPALGGGTVSIDMGKLPIQFSQDGNKFRMAIGVEMETKDDKKGGKELFDLAPKEWKKYKEWTESFKTKQIKDINESISRLKDATKKGTWKVPGKFKNKIKTEIAGFAEGTIENGNITVASSGLYIRMGWEGTYEKQFIVFHIPLVLKIKGGVEASGEYSVGIDMERMEMFTTSDLEVSIPKVKVSFGPGVCKIADVSGYGTIDNKLKIKGTDRSGADREDNQISLTLYGEAGVSVKALVFEYEKVLLNAKRKGWEYWNSITGFNPRKKERMKFGKINKKDLKVQDVEIPSEWYPKESVRDRKTGMTKVSRESKVLQKGVYAEPGVKMAVTEDGMKMMVYVSEQLERKKGNHTAVVYSIWDEQKKLWGSPEIIENDGTADFYPDIKAVGNDIYVTWTDANRNDYSDNMEFSEMANDCDISVARYNRTRKSFETTKVSNNKYFDCRPSLGTWKDGTVGLIWTRVKGDNEDELLNMSGTNEVVYTYLKDGKWEQEVIASSFNDSMPFSLRMGQIGEKDCIAFLLNTNNNNGLSGNTELYMAEKGTVPEKIELEDGAEDSLQFCNLYGNMMTWYGNQSIYYMNNYDTKNIRALAQDERITSDYKIVSGNDMAILLFANTTAQEEGTEIYGCISKDSSLFFAPLQLTGCEGYINSFDAIVENGNIQFVYGKDDVTMDNDILNRQVSIYESSVSQYHDLSISSCVLEEKAIRTERKLNFNGIIANDGFYEEENPKMIIKCDGEVISEGEINNDAWIGTEMSFQGSVKIPENIVVKKGSVITITVLPANGEDPTKNNNVFSYVIAQTDLDLTVIEDGFDEKSVIVTAENLGIYDVETTLNVRDNNSDGEIIKTVNLGELAGGEKKTLTLEVEELLNGNTGRLLYFEVVSDEKEMYENNNVSVNYLGKYIGEQYETPSPQPSDVPKPSSIPRLDFSDKVSISVHPTNKPYSTKLSSASKLKPGKIKISKLKSKKNKSIEISWKKQKNTDGYQLQYSVNKRFKPKKVKLLAASESKVILKKLASKKTYYIRIRSYRFYRGKKVYGDWSGIKKCKVK